MLPAMCADKSRPQDLLKVSRAGFMVLSISIRNVRAMLERLLLPSHVTDGPRSRFIGTLLLNLLLLLAPLLCWSVPSGDTAHHW